MNKIKKTLAIISAISVLSAVNVSAIDVNINNTRMSFDVEPQIINERTMVPMRAIFEVLGADIDWNGDTQTVTAVRGDDKISLTIGSAAMTVNGNQKELDSAPVIEDGRTLVPVRAISEALGSTVEWDGSAQTVNITDNSGFVNLDAATKYLPAWKTAYSEFLNGKKGKFELIYLTDDDIPEIVVVPNSGSHISRVNIYTYSDGAVKAITLDENGDDTFGTYSTIRYKERGNLFEQNNGGNRGIFSNNIISISGTTAHIEHTLIVDTNRGTATWNGDPVAVETVEKEVSRMIAGYKTAGYETAEAINSANIKKSLGL